LKTHHKAKLTRQEKYTDNRKKTRHGRMKCPKFYDEILEIVWSSNTIQPPHTTDTISTNVAASSEHKHDR